MPGKARGKTVVREITEITMHLHMVHMLEVCKLEWKEGCSLTSCGAKTHKIKGPVEGMDNLKENVRAAYTSVNTGPSDLF